MRWSERGICTQLVLLLACGGDQTASVRVRPVVTVENGREVAELPELPPTMSPDWRWSFTARRRIRSHEGPTGPSLGDPMRALSLSDGSVLLYDPVGITPLARFDSERDSVLVRFGHQGRGPGEIGGWVELGEEGGQIEVADGVNLQVHHFSLAGEWLGSDPFSTEGYPRTLERAPDGRGYVGQLFGRSGDEWWQELVEVGSSGSLRAFARLPEPPRGVEPGRLQRGRTLWAALSDAVVAMWSDRPVVFVHDGTGNVVREIELPLTRRRLTDRDIAVQMNRAPQYAGDLREGPAALTNMLYPVNDTVFGMYLSNLWRAAEDPAIPTDSVYWRLFTSRGEYVGLVKQPDDFRYLGRSHGAIWARLLDERLEPEVVELELVRSGESRPRGSSP